jgi:hypothetical protein
MELVQPVSDFVGIIHEHSGLFAVLALSLGIMFYSIFVLGYLIFNYKKIENKKMGLIIILLTEVIAVAELQLMVKLLSTSNYLSFDLIIHLINAVALVYSFFILNRDEGWSHILGIKPIKEKNISKSDKKYDVKKGYSYIIKETKAKKGFEIFKDHVLHGENGLIITKEIEDRIRKEYNLEKTPIIEISAKFSRNMRFEEFLGKITTFIRETQNEGIIIIDCIDRILTNMEFSTVLRMVQILRDECTKNNTILLYSLNPNIFEQKQLALIEAETEPLELEDLKR